MNILILGASGFIGSNLFKSLRLSGHAVTGYDRAEAMQGFSEKFPGANFVVGDFVTERNWAGLLNNIDVCYHLISTTNPKTSNDNPAGDVADNVIGTIRVLEALCGRNTKLVFISSGGTVYGQPNDDYLQEEHPTNPACSYGITKLAIEKYILLFTKLYGLDGVILRLANPFGPGQLPYMSQGAIAVFLAKSIKNEIIDVWGDGTTVRDYVYIGDVINALELCATYVNDKKILNIGSGIGYSLTEIIRCIDLVSGKSSSVSFHNGRLFDMPRNVLSTSQARAQLAWSPMVDLETGIRLTHAWMIDYLAAK
jgi:UDP-glucose 4-epimerase